jgi:hypothetical protein
MTYSNSISQGFLLCCIIVFGAAAMSGCTTTHQMPDVDWSPSVAHPEFPQGDGPIVLVDSAHGNMHTIDGGFRAFSDLLKLDGYRVLDADSEITPQLLDQAGVYVISNAVYGGHDAEWILPTPSAFTAVEIKVIEEWVERGGSLLLIADHMPFPGATANLANEFGIVFLNGFARKSLTEGGTMSFTRQSGLLANHAITQGRSEAEEIESIKSFSGQAFRFVTAVQPLMYMPDDWEVLMPIEAWEFSESTPTVSAKGLVQGGTLNHGLGKVAVFGEAAMFTAQQNKNGPLGMNDPEAQQNSQFVLNVLHWLTGSLAEER